MCVQRPIMALEVFLTAEATGAKRTYKLLRGILGERLLAAPSTDRLRSGSRSAGARRDCVGVR